MHNDTIKQLDSVIMNQIVDDIINGSLLLEADTETLSMMMTSIWEMRHVYERAGVIVGDA